MNASEIIKLKQAGIQAIAASGGEQELEAVRVAYLGRKGHLPSIMKGLKD